MFTIEDIQKDLPGWPKDVIQQWLLYFANEPDCGWPPPDPLGNHRWNGLLGGRPLSWWKHVTWKKQKIRCELGTLTPKARAGVTDLVSGMKRGTLDSSTKKRMAQPWLHLKDHACFPRALVTMQKPDGVSLIDGTHRMRSIARHREEHVVDAISTQGLETDFIAKVPAQLYIVVVVAFEQSVRDKCQRVRRASAVVAIEHLAGARDGGFPENLVALGFAFQQPKLGVFASIAGPDKVVAPHGQVAPILVAQAAHGNAQTDFLLDQLGRQYLAEIARPALVGLGELRTRDFHGNVVAEPLDVIGYTLKPIIVGAHGLDEVLANFITSSTPKETRT